MLHGSVRNEERSARNSPENLRVWERGVLGARHEIHLQPVGQPMVEAVFHCSRWGTMPGQICVLEQLDIPQRNCSSWRAHCYELAPTHEIFYFIFSFLLFWWGKVQEWLGGNLIARNDQPTAISEFCWSVVKNYSTAECHRGGLDSVLSVYKIGLSWTNCTHGY